MIQKWKHLAVFHQDLFRSAICAILAISSVQKAFDLTRKGHMGVLRYNFCFIVLFWLLLLIIFVC